MKHRGEILNFKKQEMIMPDGEVKFPLISYQEFIENWLPNDITAERERQYWYKKEIKRSYRLYKKYFPDFKIPRDEDEIFKCQGIEPVSWRR